MAPPGGVGDMPAGNVRGDPVVDGSKPGLKQSNVGRLGDPNPRDFGYGIKSGKNIAASKPGQGR